MFRSIREVGTRRRIDVSCGDSAAVQGGHGIHDPKLDGVTDNNVGV